MKRSVVAVVLAVNFLEWLEFSLYLYMAKSVFATSFFPASNHSLVLTFAVFAAAYLARPIGGWLFGKSADLRGRRHPMIFTAGLMGVATIGLCLLPDYQQIGALATWLLLFFRILQGLALGGEVNTSAMFMIEHHSQRPLFAGSLVAAFGALGMFMGGVFAALIQMSSNENLWRLIFALVGFISLWVCKLRKNLNESPEFMNKKEMTLNQLFPSHLRGMINIALIAIFVSISVYMCNIFWLAFATQLNVWGGVQCAWIAAIAQLGSALFAIPIAMRAKKEQAGLLLQASMITIIIFAPVLFYFTLLNQKPGIFIGLTGYMLANGLLCASFYYILYQQLPTAFRCRGVSIIWAAAASVGALALPLAQQVVFINQHYWFPGILVSIIVMALFLVTRHTLFSKPSRIKGIRTA